MLTLQGCGLSTRAIQSEVHIGKIRQKIIANIELGLLEAKRNSFVVVRAKDVVYCSAQISVPF